jgi:PAS domain S-box-containing protein
MNFLATALLLLTLILITTNAVLWRQYRAVQNKPTMQDSDNKFQLLFEYAPDAYYLSDLKGTFIDGNQKAENLVGYQREELIGKNFLRLNLLPASYIPKAVQALAKNVGGLATGPDEFVLKHKDGRQVPVEISTTLIKFKGQTLVLGIARDVTERQQIEQEQALENRMLEAINQLSKDVLSTFDLAEILQVALQTAVKFLDVTSGYISDWDEAQNTITTIAEYYTPYANEMERVSDMGVAYKLDEEFGVTSEWMLPPYDRFVTHWDDANATLQEREHIIKFGAKSIVEVPLRAKDKPIGTLELWESRRKRIFSTHELSFALAIARQVALAIENARLYEETLAASRLKSALLANVSHELRTPLSVILIRAEMLEAGIYGEMTAQQKGILQQTINSAHMLTRLVNELIVGAQLEAGQLGLQVEEFSPQNVVTSALEQMSMFAQVKELQLVQEIAPNLPERLWGDPERIHQILLNLIGNGIKFTPQGMVKVRAYQANERQWALQISDTGAGIPQEAQAFIFEPFRQVDDSATRQHGGSGLGLAIVKQLSVLMGGEVVLESQPGHGSKFTVFLPIMTEK